MVVATAWIRVEKKSAKKARLDSDNSEKPAAGSPSWKAIRAGLCLRAKEYADDEEPSENSD